MSHSAGARFSVLALLLAGTAAAHADPVPRTPPVAGSVIARKSGEEVKFVDLSNWRVVDLNQDVLPGDYLRTNATGNLAVLFADRTQMRLGRNTTLLVKKIGAASDSEFGLESGSLWARAERGGEGLTIDTPAAAAAVRGTDWSLSVDPDGKTSLIVLEGRVELSNAQGSVTVAQGEAAVARIGEAPTKVFVVAPKDREQMLFYLSLRSAFAVLPASDLSATQMRRERGRINAVPAASRSGEDWVKLAEVSLSYDGQAAAAEAVAAARRKPLTAGQRARLDLVEALLAGADKRYGEAAGLFARAAKGLDRRRRAMALYGGYYARALADPKRAEQPPRFAAADGPYAAIAEAFTVGFLVDIKAAMAVIRKAEARYPDDPSLPVVRAKLALLLDDREQMAQALDRALELDPDNPDALEARADYRGGYKGDVKGAYADLERAVALAPGSSNIWNSLGLAQSTRGARLEAEQALKRAIALDPNDPVAHANLAIFYLEDNRNAEAKTEIDAALAADPAFDIALVARGRYHLQNGELDKARDDLLAGTTANPAYAQGLLLLSATDFELGERDGAQQALDNADRLDPNDPVIASVRTAMAINDYDADTAIASAQEALRRTRARGGDYAPLSASRDAGSDLNNAFRLGGLDAWGRFYGDAVFDPFSGSAFVDQSLSGSVNPFVNNLRYGDSPTEPTFNALSQGSLIQALLLDPQLVSAPSRSPNIVRRPFTELTLGGTWVVDPGWKAEGEFQSFQATPFPWSSYVDIRGLDVSERRGSDPVAGQYDFDDKGVSGTGYLTARPTPADSVVAFLDSRKTDTDIAAFADPANFPLGARLTDDSDGRTTTGGLAWSHLFGYRNVASVAGFVSDSDGTVQSDRIAQTLLGPFGQSRQTGTESRSYSLGANHSIGIGEFTLRYGAEGGHLLVNRDLTDTVLIPGFPNVSATGSQRAGVDFGRIYADGLYDLTPDLKLEGALFGTFLRGDGNVDTSRLDGRAGLAWMPFDGQYLRAGYIREGTSLTSATLAPIGVLGLQQNQVGLGLQGYADTFAARWDAEWTDFLFTSVDYQHQDLHGMSIAVPAAVGNIDIDRGRLDRASATANLWLGHGLGAFATYAWMGSDNRDPASAGFGRDLPFVPEHSARLGLSYVNPANVKVTFAETYIGPRAGDVTGTRLDGYWSADAFLTWEPFDKRFTLDLAAYNLFDQGFDLATRTPGWGRSIVGSLKVHF